MLPPLEIRALCDSRFVLCRRDLLGGGVVAPALFGWLIESGEPPF